jgi:ribose-phosphate pyrophosphokinase
MDLKSNFTLFSGRANVRLAEDVARCLKISLGEIVIEDFPDGEIGVRINENVRGRDVFVMQSIAKQPNFYLMELLILIDALKRASARSIYAVLPYYCYARQDRKERGREPITAKLVADLLQTVGVTGLMTMDLHTEQIQGFFNIPVDHLYARPALVKALGAYGIKDCIVVTPDIGSVRLGRALSSDLHADLAIINKRRLDAEQVEANALIGDIKGRDVVLVDDMISTGQTLIKAAKACRALGAKRVFGVVTHGLMVDDIDIEGVIDRLFLTDTIAKPEAYMSKHVEIVSVASLFGQAIQSVIDGNSFSSLFKS